MTQFGNTAMPGISGRNQAYQVPTLGLQSSLAAPGVVVAPPDLSTANDIQRLQQALGLSGHLVAEAGQLANQERIRIEHENAKVDVLDHGLAARHRQFAQIEFAKGVEDGTIRVPDGEDVGKFSDQFVKSYLNTAQPNASQAYASEFLKAGPDLAQMIEAKRQQDVQKAKIDNAGLAIDSAYGSEDAAGVTKARDYAVNVLGLSERAADEVIVLGAAKKAAAIGNVDKANMILSTLPAGTLAGDADAVRAHAIATQATQQSQAWSQNEDVLQRMVDAGDSTGAVRAMVEDMNSRNELAPGAAAKWHSELARVDALQQKQAVAGSINGVYGYVYQTGDVDGGYKKIESLGLPPEEMVKAQNSLREAFSARIKEQKDREEKQIFDYTAGVVAYSGLTGNLKQAVSEAASKTELSENDLEKEAWKRLFAQADSEALAAHPNNPKAAEEDSMRRKVRVAATNGTLPPQWKEIIQTGAAAANPTQMLEGKISPATIRAYELYYQMEHDAPGLAAHAATGKANELFENALLSQPVYGNDHAAALTAAAMLTYRDPEEKSRDAQKITNEQISSATNNLQPGLLTRIFTDKQKFANEGEVQSMIRRIASMYPATTPARAIERATEIVKARGMEINGWWVQAPEGTSDETRQQIATIATDKAGQWIKDHPAQAKALALSSSDVRALFDPLGRVYLGDPDGRPLPSTPLLSVNDIRKAYSEKIRSGWIPPANIPTSVVEKANARPAPRMGRNVIE